MRRATVWWGDAHGEAGLEMTREELDQKHKPCIQATTGWVFRYDKIGITLIMVLAEFDPPEGYILSSPYRYREFVPRKMIRRIEWLEAKP